jgi:hypothetical protein
MSYRAVDVKQLVEAQGNEGYAEAMAAMKYTDDSVAALADPAWDVIDMTPVAGLITITDLSGTYATLADLVAAVGVSPGGYFQLSNGDDLHFNPIISITAAAILLTAGQATPVAGDIYSLSGDSSILTYMSTLADANGVCIPLSNLQLAVYCGNLPDSSATLVAPNGANDMSQQPTSYLARRTVPCMAANGLALQKRQYALHYYLRSCSLGYDIFYDSDYSGNQGCPCINSVADGIAMGYRTAVGTEDYQSTQTAVVAIADSHNPYITGGIVLALSATASGNTNPINAATVFATNGPISVQGQCEFVIDYVPVS